MHVCLFDIDGTLISSGGAGKAALEAALASEYGITHVIGRLQLSGRTDRAIIRDLFRQFTIDDSPANLERILSAYLALLPAYLASHRGKVLPGIRALLQQLQARDDVALGLLTGNIRDGARVKLGFFQLFDHFALGGFGDRHFDRDDVAREALAAAHKHLPGIVNANRVWVVGDTPLDIRCARAIGARAVAVTTGWHPREELAASRPDLLLTDLEDSAPFLDALSTHGT
jgi:phosphoglycolate phosphatase